MTHLVLMRAILPNLGHTLGDCLVVMHGSLGSTDNCREIGSKDRTIGFFLIVCRFRKCVTIWIETFVYWLQT